MYLLMFVTLLLRSAFGGPAFDVVTEGTTMNPEYFRPAAKGEFPSKLVYYEKNWL